MLSHNYWVGGGGAAGAAQYVCIDFRVSSILLLCNKNLHNNYIHTIINNHCCICQANL